MTRTRLNLKVTFTLCLLNLYSANSAAEGSIQKCIDAGYTGEALAICSAYDVAGCIPEMGNLCADFRQSFFEASGDVVMPSDCDTPSALQSLHQYIVNPLPPAPPEPEPVSVTTIPLPEHITKIGASVDWNEYGDKVYFSFESSQYQGRNSGVISPDGSNFECTTCGLGDLDVAGSNRIDFQRMIVSGPGAPAPRTILECAPSLDDCQTSMLVPIDIPGATDARIVIPEGTTFAAFSR